ncbi:MAG: hypothetical protein R3248_10235 [Candidatus Promineifilaceae bacterium]|nr:hypothetical protein [Candidatus Promineifilaceae bacterium]
MNLLQELMEIILYVEDMNGQVTFYRDKLGLPVNYPAGLEDYADQMWVALDAGNCVLALHGGGEGRLGADAPKIVFRVEDVNAARKELVGRGVELGNVRDDVPGKLICDGVDPEGNKFALESEVS